MSDPETALPKTRRRTEGQQDKPRAHGLTPSEARASLTALYRATRDGRSFAAALEEAGFRLVKTTRRVLQAIDRHGAAHTLIARIDAPKEEIEQRLADIPADHIKPKPTREKEAQVILHCSPDEKAEIEARAERAGLSLSGYLRVLAFGKDTPQPRAARRPPVEKETLLRFLGELGKMGSNLNQIAHAVNLGRPADSRLLALLAVELGELRQQIKAALGREDSAPEAPAPNPEETHTSSLAEKLFGRGKAA